MQEDEHIAGKILKVNVSGKNSETWKRLQSKMLKTISRFLDSTAHHDRGTTWREEAKKTTGLALEFAQEKLKSAGLDNERTIAEIEEKYALIQRTKAEARKLNAEEDQIRFDTDLKKLLLTLKMYKAFTIDMPNGEAVVITEQIDHFIGVLSEFKEGQSVTDV